MSVTAQEIFDIVMDLSDDANDSTLVAEYEGRTPGMLTLIQSALLQESKYTKTHTITRTKPVTGLRSFETLLHEDEDETHECGEPVFGYAFTSTGTGTVYIEDWVSGWNPVAVITVTADTEYTGTVTGTAGATRSRIRLAGDYVFGVNNYALYKAEYETVPSFAPYVLEDMPSDFNAFEDVVSIECGEYSQNKPYQWEENGQLYVDVDYSGVIRVIYYPNVVAITSMTDSLVLNERLCKSTVAYMLGMELYKEANDILYNHFYKMYLDTKSMNKTPRKSNTGTVYNEYGGF